MHRPENGKEDVILEEARLLEPDQGRESERAPEQASERSLRNLGLGELAQMGG